MSFLVLHPGTYSLLVDAGRPRSRCLGIPLGGAADRAALAIGNALAGNSNNAVALEMTFSGPTLVAERDVSACVFGASFRIQLDEEIIAAGSLFQVRAGQTLKIGGASRGVRAYLCVRGGFESKSILESGSAFAPITEHDRLVCPASKGSGRTLSYANVEALFDESERDGVITDKSGRTPTLRVIDGPQTDWFSDREFYQQTFAVSPASNRMGVRLLGEPLIRQPREMISEAVTPGATQITNEGLPIVLGVDGQTIGGYPKIAQVIGADLDRIAQLRPGQQIHFERISIDEAEALSQKHRSKLRKWLTALRLSAE